METSISTAYADNIPDYKYTTWEATIERPDRVPKRSLLLFPISMGSKRHEYSPLHASLKAVNSTFRDPESSAVTVVIHVTDRIHAFRFMAEDPTLSLTDAQKRADQNGTDWVNRNINRLNLVFGTQPVIYQWAQWQDVHRQEYEEVLGQISAVYEGNPPYFNQSFHNAVNKDGQSYHERKLREQGLPPSELDERVKKLYAQYVLHEAAGYVVMGRHLASDYMETLKQAGGMAETIANWLTLRGGLNETIYRLYPGGHLKAIDMLRNGLQHAPRGAEKIMTIKINQKEGVVSNDDMLKSPGEIRLKTLYPALKNMGTTGSPSEQEKGAANHHSSFPTASLAPFRPRTLQQHVMGNRRAFNRDVA